MQHGGSSASFIVERHEFDSLPFARGVTFLKLLYISEHQFLYLSNEDHQNKPAESLKEINLMLAIWFSFSKWQLCLGVSLGAG